ncbi:MAG: P-loop NTPase [Desulfobacterales bacterium]|nr:P-loop NTPase [Desulfobacterales bacterium]
MKIIICGKGGSGKSTIATLTARALSQRGVKIFLVDADESNVGLHRLLGAGEPVVFLDKIGGKKGLGEKLKNAFPQGSTDVIVGPNSRTDDLPPECVAEIDGIRLFSVGKIHQLNEGCACPMGRLSKTFLSNLVIGPEEILIIDAEAGIEHFGRGVDAACDLILVVVEPSFESFLLADKIKAMARKADIDVNFVLNKVETRVEAFMNEHIDQDLVAARIPASDEIFMNSLQGKRITAQPPEILELCELVEAKKKALNLIAARTPGRLERIRI